MIKRFVDESGYSMVEVLAAIVILSVAILPMVGMFDAGLRAAVLGGNYDQARALANEKLENVEALGYGEAAEKYDPAADQTTAPFIGSEEGFDYEIETQYARLDPDTDSIVTDSSGTMLWISVRVSWDGGSKDFQTTGLLASGGV